MAAGAEEQERHRLDARAATAAASESPRTMPGQPSSIEVGERTATSAPRRGSARRRPRPRRAAPSSGPRAMGEQEQAARFIGTLTSQPEGRQRHQQEQRARRRRRHQIQGVQSRSRPRWPAMLLSSTKEMPSMMPANTFPADAARPGMQVGEGQGERHHHEAGEGVERAFPELDLVALRRLLVVGQVADVAEQLDRRHGRQRQHGRRHHAGRERTLGARPAWRASPRWPRRGRRRRQARPARHANVVELPGVVVADAGAAAVMRRTSRPSLSNSKMRTSCMLPSAPAEPTFTEC